MALLPGGRRSRSAPGFVWCVLSCEPRSPSFLADPPAVSGPSVRTEGGSRPESSVPRDFGAAAGPGPLVVSSGRALMIPKRAGTGWGYCPWARFGGAGNRGAATGIFRSTTPPPSSSPHQNQRGSGLAPGPVWSGPVAAKTRWPEGNESSRTSPFLRWGSGFSRCPGERAGRSPGQARESARLRVGTD